ncbi:MAG TPA: C4-dicarboxylate ABC transporter [Bacilli bacterium]
MPENNNVQNKTDASALWMGWIGIVAGVIAFFYAPFIFGAVAVVLGLITVFSKANTLGWWACALGVIGAIANGWFY